MVKNPPSNAGDVGSIPGGGTKIPHALGQLSPRATTIELACLKREPACHNYRVHVPWSLGATAREGETHTPPLERSPRTATREKP